MVSLGQKFKKFQKHAKNHSTRTLEMFCAKNRSKKHQVLEKWDDFENRPSCKGYSPCKGYSLCKMVTLGHKVKIPKTFEKAFYKNIRVVLCKKPLEKTPKKFEIWDDFENRPSCKGYSPCKGYNLCKMVTLGQKFKIPKTCEKPFYKNIRVVLCKKPAQKNTKDSRNETILKIGHLAKAIAIQRL